MEHTFVLGVGGGGMGEGWQMYSPPGSFTDRYTSFIINTVIYENNKLSYHIIKHLKTEYNLNIL